MAVAAAPVVQLVAAPDLQVLAVRVPQAAWQHAVALVVQEIHFQEVTAVVAPAVAEAAGTVAAALARTAAAGLIVTAVVVVAAAPGRPAAASPPVAMAVQPSQQVAADESSLLIARALVMRPRRGTNLMDDM